MRYIDNIDFRTVFGIVSVGTVLFGYSLYIRDIFRKTTRPHAFSWLIWSIPDAIAFIIQVYHGAGAGSWAMGTATIGCCIIFVLSLFYGDLHFPTFDWIMLVLALSVIGIWFITYDSFTTIILNTIANVIGFFPTIRKSFFEPHSETAFMYGLEVGRQICSIIALSSISVLTVLFPFMSLIMNAIIVILLILRRRI